MARWLIPTMSMFVDGTGQFPLTVVLDDESPRDHAYGTCLEASVPFVRVCYEPLPPDWRSVFHGTADLDNPSTARPGYDRQQWSTFYLDRHVSEDLIGVVDSDACLYSFLTRESVLAADGRVILRAMAGGDDYYGEGDALALGINNSKAELRWDFMWTEKMPIWLWRGTFERARHHIMDVWGVSSFEEAFRQFSDGHRYSQFNILLNYAATHEPHLYHVVPNTAPEEDGVASVGSNRACDPPGWTTRGLDDLIDGWAAEDSRQGGQLSRSLQPFDLDTIRNVLRFQISNRGWSAAKDLLSVLILYSFGGLFLDTTFEGLPANFSSTLSESDREMLRAMKKEATSEMSSSWKRDLFPSPGGGNGGGVAEFRFPGHAGNNQQRNVDTGSNNDDDDDELAYDQLCDQRVCPALPCRKL
eukprot:g5956.t1